MHWSFNITLDPTKNKKFGHNFCNKTYALRAPPPFACPSILVTITAPTETLCLKAWAWSNAAWPMLLSITKITRSGFWKMQIKYISNIGNQQQINRNKARPENYRCFWNLTHFFKKSSFLFVTPTGVNNYQITIFFLECFHTFHCNFYRIWFCIAVSFENHLNYYLNKEECII